MTPLVTIRPGYSVPPVTRPSGCHVSVGEKNVAVSGSIRRKSHTHEVFDVVLYIDVGQGRGKDILSSNQSQNP